MKGKYIFFVFLFVTFVCFPFVSIAAIGGGSDGGLGGGSDGGIGGGSSNSNFVKLSNPLGDIDSFPELIKAILDGTFIIGLPVAVLFIVIAGFRFVWARGNPTELDKAKTNLLYTVVGIAVFFGAWLITEVIVGTLARLNIDI
ncbi:hypothetical protein A3F55_02545 [Candidatus Adlerbacteria bacterium RIFCSPHIGHO2_12_FULL_53_18]|uniref:Uncharacterized protein n=1 Tax=Candidatus Adlerbacteria bacterium RIFCSPHIGHO2_12_FULL_53_18 TaxID=1797242 RepID=A0A1F4XT49_9BACT|nr:MAG: hypothetical protein A3F55_02545 [Candidatus Adlerbacteria bacterium RIFCSPHIGHO2_12_FULL_53_18]